MLEVKVVDGHGEHDQLRADRSTTGTTRTFDFKYSDTRTFDVGNRVHVQLGYADRLRSMMRGPDRDARRRGSPSPARRRSTSASLDGMLKLRDRKPAEGERKKYVEHGRLGDRAGDRRSATACGRRDRGGREAREVVQKNQDDAKFLMERAKRIDFDCFVADRPGHRRGHAPLRAPDRRARRRRVRVYEFRWGESLISFTPALTLSRQVASVTVRGWDPRTKAAICFTATAARPAGAAELGERTGQRPRKLDRDGRRIVVDAPVLDRARRRESSRSACCASAPTSSSPAPAASSGSPTCARATTST